MLKHRNNIPLDYSLCQDTVTVYHREGLTRRVLQGVHFEPTLHRSVDTGREADTTGFLLVIPGGFGIGVGDKVAPGEGPEVASWADTVGFAAVTSVQHRHFKGRLCHTEARG